MLGENRIIEEGCLAVIVNSRTVNVGKTLTVGKFLGCVSGFIGDRRWEVDRPIVPLWGGDVYHVEESQLLRIDGYNFEQEETQNELDAQLCA